MKVNHDLIWLVLLYLVINNKPEGVLKYLVYGLFIVYGISYLYNRYKNQ